MEKTAKNLRKYEIVVMVKALLPDDVRTKALEDVRGIVNKHGGEVKNTDIWGKRYLAYKIKSHNEGYYVIYEVKLPPESIKEVGTDLSHQQDILRYVVLKEGEGKILEKIGKKSSVIAFDKDIKL